MAALEILQSNWALCLDPTERASMSKMTRFENALTSDGVDAALAVLNEGIPHRYTGIFELQGNNLLNRHVFDKTGAPKDSYLDVVPFSDSFCQIAMREGEYRSDNTANDPRVDYSPFKGIVVSYQGVPLLARDLNLSGTLCHFDVVERSLDDLEFQCLIEAARLLPPFIQRT